MLTQYFWTSKQLYRTAAFHAVIQGPKNRGFLSSTCAIQDHSWGHLHYIQAEKRKNPEGESYIQLQGTQEHSVGNVAIFQVQHPLWKWKHEFLEIPRHH